mgnify:CR=1 FL=1
MGLDMNGEDGDGVLREWMTRPELARELGVSAATLGRWGTRRIGPEFIRVGRQILYRRETVRAWLEAEEARKARAYG